VHQFMNKVGEKHDAECKNNSGKYISTRFLLYWHICRNVEIPYKQCNSYHRHVYKKDTLPAAISSNDAAQ
jgi:hypothetical protein